jgi:hypothetical protein
MPAIDKFFATYIFGAQRIHHFRAQHTDLGPSIATDDAREHDLSRTGFHGGRVSRFSFS